MTTGKPDPGYCNYLHCDLRLEEWSRCPDATVKYYERTSDGISDNAWYCDEGAKEAQKDGIFLRLISEHP